MSGTNRNAPPDIEAISEAISQLCMLRHRFGELGMLRTMQTLDVPVKACGYELADKLGKIKDASEGEK